MVFKLVSLPGSCFESVSGSHPIASDVLTFPLSAHWRQIYFRPTKPLPKDVQFGGRPFPIHEHRPFRRAFFDFIVSCICLGIPYFFLERVRLSGRSSDQESGLLRGPAPIFIIGACTCLMVSLLLLDCPLFFSILSEGCTGTERVCNVPLFARLGRSYTECEHGRGAVRCVRGRRYWSVCLEAQG
jgi:hypothetical protein